jgi:hypothetical protein
MPYFKPFPAADESALKRFGGRAQTVVRRCTRTSAFRPNHPSIKINRIHSQALPIRDFRHRLHGEAVAGSWGCAVHKDTLGAWPTTLVSSRCPRSFTRRTQKPVSSLWNVTRSTQPVRTSVGSDEPPDLMSRVPAWLDGVRGSQGVSRNNRPQRALRIVRAS